MSIRNLFPLALQQCSSTTVLASGFLRPLHQYNSLHDHFFHINFIFSGDFWYFIWLTKPDKAVLNEDVKMMFVYFKKSSTQSPAKQCFLRKYQVIELSLFPASFKKKFPNLSKHFWLELYPKATQCSAVCDCSVWRKVIS